MEQHMELSLQDFREVLSPTAVKILQIIHVAMAGGVIIYAGVVALLSTLPQPGQSPSLLSTVRILSLVHAVLAIVLFALAKWLFDRFLRPERMSERLGMAVDKPRDGFAVPEDKSRVGLSAPTGGSRGGLSVPDTPAGRFYNAVRAAMIARLALMEGAALFGVTVSLLAALDGILAVNPLYWLNLLSALAFVLFVARNFPTKGRLEDLFREKRSLLSPSMLE